MARRGSGLPTCGAQGLSLADLTSATVTSLGPPAQVGGKGLSDGDRHDSRWGSSEHIGKDSIPTALVEKVTGTAVFAGHVRLPGMLHGALVKSMVPRGTIRHIDVGGAWEVPGVVGRGDCGGSPSVAVSSERWLKRGRQRYGWLRANKRRGGAASFLERYPTPESASRLGEARLAAFLKRRHSYCGHRSPAQLLERLRLAPTAPSGLGSEVWAVMVRQQVRLLRALLRTKELEHAIAVVLPEHPKTAVLAGLPRIGDCVNLAQVLSEVGPILDASLDGEHAATQCGASPVTKASGQSRGVHFRWAANNRARKALQIFGDNSRRASPWAAELYAKHIALKKRHPHAIRILMRAWLRVIWACWHSETPYDAARHRGELRLAK
ncbi:MAG: transposase [Candidatus Acidiferrales bacterium]